MIKQKVGKSETGAPTEKVERREQSDRFRQSIRPEEEKQRDSSVGKDSDEQESVGSGRYEILPELWWFVVEIEAAGVSEDSASYADYL